VLTRLKSFGYGLGDGLLDLIAKPAEGAKRNGTLGFATGCAKGFGNAMFKPVAGKYLGPILRVFDADAEAQVRVDLLAMLLWVYTRRSRISDSRTTKHVQQIWYGSWVKRSGRKRQNRINSTLYGIGVRQ
jgi:hypothetical protein